MRRTALITAGLLLGAGLLGGCGGGDDGGSKASGGDYCDTLKEAQKNIKSFTAEDATPDFSKFQDFLDTAKELADEAPSKIKDDWDTMLGAMNDLTSALKDAGLTIEDFGKATSSGQLPDGVDQTKLAELSTKLQSLDSTEIQKAGDAINKQAKDDCGVDLDKS